MTWNPKVGDPVKFTAESTHSGALVNVLALRVGRITKAGFIHCDRLRTNLKFRVSPGHDPDEPVAYDHRTRSSGSTGYRYRLEPITEEEFHVLPQTPEASRDYVRQKRRAARARD